MMGKVLKAVLPHVVKNWDGNFLFLYIFKMEKWKNGKIRLMML